MSVSKYASVEAANQQNTTVHFDYSSVSPSVAKFLKGQLERIRRSTSKSIVEIGKDLIGAKHYLSHGAFLRWVEYEVGLPARTAQAYMQVAQWVSQKSVGTATLPPTLLYLLSAPSTPEEFISSVLKRIGAGEQITFQSVRRELKALREAKCGIASTDSCAEFQTEELKTPLAPLKQDVAAIITEAIAILARGLSKVDFKRVHEMMTSKPVLNDPGLAQKIVVAFKTIEKSPQLDHKARSKNGSYHWQSRDSDEAADAADVTSMDSRHPSSQLRIAS